MKILKVLILVFAVVGLASMFMPMGDDVPSFFSLFMELDKVFTLLILASFGVPALMGLLGLARPPFQAWQGIASLAGFALAAVKLKLWSSIGEMGGGPLQGKLMVGAIVGGLIVSALAVAMPEKT